MKNLIASILQVSGGDEESFGPPDYEEGQSVLHRQEEPCPPIPRMQGMTEARGTF